MKEVKLKSDSYVSMQLKKIFPESEELKKSTSETRNEALNRDLQKIFDERKIETVAIISKTRALDIDCIHWGRFCFRNWLFKALIARKIRKSSQKYFPSMVAVLFKKDEWTIS